MILWRVACLNDASMLFFFSAVCSLFADVKNEDSGNYTCEVHGGGYKSTILASVVHYLFVRGQQAHIAQ